MVHKANLSPYIIWKTMDLINTDGFSSSLLSCENLHLLLVHGFVQYTQSLCAFLVCIDLALNVEIKWWYIIHTVHSVDSKTNKGNEL